jgi:glycosyltransferase involved in cell wall biosynthesis
MSIVCVVLDDGRPDYLRHAVASLEKHVFLIDEMVLINDSGDPHYAEQMRVQYPQFDKQVHHETRRGLAGAVRSAWETAWDMNADYVLHWEGDMVAQCEIPLHDMVGILDNDPLLAQIALYRQPVNAEESAVGGYMQQYADEYTQRDGYVSTHRLFTFNPMLVPIDVTQLCLAEPGDGLERGITDTLNFYNFHFGIFGNINDDPRVLHIGNNRAQGWHT